MGGTDDARAGEGLGLIFWQIDRAGHLARGAGWAGAFGAPPGAAPETPVQHVHPDDRAGFGALLASGRPGALALRLVGPDGTAWPALCRCAPRDGGVEGVFVPMPDPEAAPAPAALASARAEADFLRGALERLPDAVFLLDSEGRFVIANEKVRELFPLMSDTMAPGRPFEEMLRIGLARGAYPEAVGREEDWLAGALAFWTGAATQVERTVRLANGRWVMAIDRRLDGGGWIGLRVDVTGVKQSEARLAAILDGSGHGTWEWDVPTQTCVTNPLIDRTIDRWLASVGYARSDVATTPIDLFRSIAHPDDLARLDEMKARHIAGEIDEVDAEVRQRHRDGHWVWGRMRGKVSERDLDGRPLRMAGVIMDITDLKNVHLALERSARLKVEFLERMSHEIRTPLNGVLGAVSVLAATTTDPAQRDLLAIAEESGARLVALFDRLVELTRLEDGRVEFDLAPFRLEGLAEDLRAAHAPAAAAKGIGLDVLTDSTAVLARLGDRRRLREVVDSLVGSAIARTDAGGVEIRIRGQGADVVRIEVLDDDGAMDEETRLRALEPFFHEQGNARPVSTDDALGLWPARRLVEAMGGRLSLAPRRTGGTIARVEVPLPRVA